MRSTAEERCPHCGRLLVPRTVPAPVPFGGFAKGDPIRVGTVPCVCEESAAERAAEAERRAKEARDAEEALYLSRLRRAGVPERYLRASHPDADALAAKVEAGRSLYLVGPYGCGKTHLAAAIVRRVAWQGGTARMLTGIDLTMALQATYGTSESEAAVLRGLASRRLLVLDDLGKEPPTEWALSRLFAVVNRRYEQEAPVVVTTNFERDELVARLGRKGDASTAEALVSRLCEGCDVVRMAGPDRRLAGRGAS